MDNLENAFNPLCLRAEGNYVILEIEVNKKWIELIKERLDSPFSHIIESLGIQRAIEKAALQTSAGWSDEDMIEAYKEGTDWDKKGYGSYITGEVNFDKIAKKWLTQYKQSQNKS